MHRYTVTFRPIEKGQSHTVKGVSAPTSNDALLWGFNAQVAAGWPIESLGYNVAVKREK